jgi:class 3 adenylate cyclase/tetratricopeptide (TPR) repeat protein
VIACPACGEENPDRARFCLACGSAVAAPAEAPRKERKYATALFADLVGSTTLAEQEDPEVVQSVVGRAFDRLAEEIARYEGLLEKFMGDAVLAVFGVPRVHEDDPERAVRVALEMQAILSELNRGFASEGRPTLEMRIGIEAGEVLVDTERASGPRDRMLTGDAVNTAARLQTAAEPGRVVVGPAVHEATREVVEFRELPPLDLKGKSEPVPAWEALRIRARLRGERPYLGMEARLVGRDEELAVLTQTLRRVQSEGRPALVTVIGPAGVGKSRLVHELERHVEASPEFVYWRRGRCLAYGNTSYSALADAIKAQCEILEDDPTETAGAKTDAAVQELFGDDSIAPQVRTLVGAGEPGSFSREVLFEAWRRFLERMAARYPFVLVLEDLHWADDGLLDFVEHLADWAQGPIMVAALARPELFERRPTWGGGKRNAASIFLDPLSTGEALSMLDDLLPGALPEDLRSRIVERSEGNPLYVEELVRIMIQQGTLRETDGRWQLAGPVGDIELPRSIQGLIAARLDGLPDDEKSILQDAAVVGRVFWTGAIEHLTGRSRDDVREVMGRLRVKELVMQQDPPSFSDEQEFSFRHVLLRDGAYDSLPKALRAEKHEAVATWAERRSGDRAGEIAELIATHLLGAVRYRAQIGAPDEEVSRRALTWCVSAAERANALLQPAESTRWYRDALEIGRALDIPVSELSALASALAAVAGGVVDHEEWGRLAVDAQRLAEEAGDAAAAGWALTTRALVAFMLGDDEGAERLGLDAISILQPFGDSRGLARARQWLGQYYWRRGRLDEAEPLLRESMEIAERVGASLEYAEAMHTLSIVLVSRPGDSTEGLQMIEKSYVLAQETNDLPLLLRIYNNLPAVLADGASDYRRAQALLLEGRELARKTASRAHEAWIVGSLGDVGTSLGTLPEAERYQREALDLARAVGDEPLVGMRLDGLARVLALRGNLDEAEMLADESRRILSANPEPQSEIYMHGLDALLADARGRDRDAIAAFERAVHVFSTYGAEHGPSTFLAFARLLVRMGEVDRAAELRGAGGADTPTARASATAIEGLVASDPSAAVAHLREAAEGFEATGERIELALVLLDLGRAERAVGQDPRTTLERTRDLLVACDARLYLPEAEAELAATE